MSVVLSNKQRRVIRGVMRREYKATVSEVDILLSEDKILETLEIVNAKGPLTTSDRMLEFGFPPVIIQKPISKQKGESEKNEKSELPSGGGLELPGMIKKSDHNRVVAMYNKVKSKKLVNISAKIQENHEFSLKEIAIQQDRTVSWLVRKAVEEYIDKHKK